MSVLNEEPAGAPQLKRLGEILENIGTEHLFYAPQVSSMVSTKAMVERYLPTLRTVIDLTADARKSLVIHAGKETDMTPNAIAKLAGVTNKTAANWIRQAQEGSE